MVKEKKGFPRLRKKVFITPEKPPEKEEVEKTYRAHTKRKKRPALKPKCEAKPE